MAWQYPNSVLHSAHLYYMRSVYSAGRRFDGLRMNSGYIAADHIPAVHNSAGFHMGSGHTAAGYSPADFRMRSVRTAAGHVPADNVFHSINLS